MLIRLCEVKTVVVTPLMTFEGEDNGRRTVVVADLYQALGFDKGNKMRMRLNGRGCGSSITQIMRPREGFGVRGCQGALEGKVPGNG